MDNRYYENVIKEMQPFLDEQSFVKKEDGSFANGKKAFKVEYDEAKQMYILNIADIEEGKAGEYSEANSWLFDDSQNAKDAASVGVDFVGTLRSSLGIKIKRANITDIELPSMNKSGSITVSGFTKKLLDIFPSLKENYKEHIAAYGNFLYLNFFGEYVVPQVKAVLLSGNKKQIKKIYDLFEDIYVHGDKDTVNSEIAILCAACYNDDEAYDAVKQMLAEDSHFLMSVQNFRPALAKNKKLRAALIK
ncbi:MAG: hypothetical protein IJ470_01730 [Clostridia bacterium]|nr:hypothetical protein [Clostridia bacterium]